MITLTYCNEAGEGTASRTPASSRRRAHEVKRLRAHAQTLVELNSGGEAGTLLVRGVKAQVTERHLKAVLGFFCLPPKEPRKAREDDRCASLHRRVQRRRVLRLVEDEGAVCVHVVVKRADRQEVIGGSRFHDSGPGKGIRGRREGAQPLRVFLRVGV